MMQADRLRAVANKGHVLFCLLTLGADLRNKDLPKGASGARLSSIVLFAGLAATSLRSCAVEYLQPELLLLLAARTAAIAASQSSAALGQNTQCCLAVTKALSKADLVLVCCCCCCCCLAGVKGCALGMRYTRTACAAAAAAAAAVADALQVSRAAIQAHPAHLAAPHVAASPGKVSTPGAAAMLQYQLLARRTTALECWGCCLMRKSTCELAAASAVVEAWDLRHKLKRILG
jgi:hypothetical protein